MKIAVQPGAVIAHAPSAARLSGAMTVIGVRVGIAVNDVANGVEGMFAVEGVYNYAKLSTDVVAQGALLYFDAGNNRLTTTVGSNVLAGYAFAAAGNGVPTVDIKINA